MICNHDCNTCGGCAVRDLTMTKEELELLLTFRDFPFQPVARKSSSEIPVSREHGYDDMDLTSRLILLLEKKGLVDIDYKIPLHGFDYAAYSAWNVHGSMALTERGQQVLDLLDIQGITSD